MNEEDAIADRSSSSSLALTNRIWAFFSKLDFVVSKTEVMARKSAQAPISGLDSERMSMTKLMNPKKVRENL